MLKFLKQLLCLHKHITTSKFYGFADKAAPHLIVYQQTLCSDCGKRTNKKICDYSSIYWNLSKIAQHLEDKGVQRIENSVVIV